MPTTKQEVRMMADDPAPSGSGSPIPVTRLTESFRFDDELASILTAFQYRHDDISLTSSQTRQLPVDAVEPATPGLAAALDPDASVTFLVHDSRGHRTVNPVEVAVTHSLVDALPLPASETTVEDAEAGADVGEGPLADGASEGGAAAADGSGDDEEPASAADGDAGNDASGETDTPSSSAAETTDEAVSVGVVTPHNAQRGRLDATLPDAVTTNTVEKYQGGERDVMIVSATVSDPTFARQEDAFILDPRRLLVAVSRARIKTIVVCSDALFQVAPEDTEQLDAGLVWNRLFLLAAGRDASPAWDGPLADFCVGSLTADQDLSDVQLGVYPSAGVPDKTRPDGDHSQHHQGGSS